MKSVSAAISGHLSIDRIATSASRYFDLCVTGDTVPNPQRLSLTSQALDLFNQVFVAFLKFFQLARSHHGTDIRYTIRVTHLAERHFVTVHRSLFARKVIVHHQTIPTRENALHVWLAVFKTSEVRQNIGLITIGQFLKWLHFGSTLVAATAKEILCPSTTDHQEYNNENGHNNKRFHSRFLMSVVIATSSAYGFYLYPSLSICVHLRSSADLFNQFFGIVNANINFRPVFI